METLSAGAAAVPASSARSHRAALVLAALWTLTGGAYGCVLPFLTVYAAGRGLTLTGIGIRITRLTTVISGKDNSIC